MSDITAIIKASGINENEQLAIETTFGIYKKIAEDWKAKADEIIIVDENDKKSMKEADEARKTLKKFRVEIEHKRKNMKEESLRKGKLIDSVAKLYTEQIEPIEISLLEKSKFAENLRKEKEEALRIKRNEEIKPLSEFVPSIYDFGLMSEEDYLKVLNGAKLQLEQKLEAEKRAEEERIEAQRFAEELRIAREKAEAEALEKVIKENEELKRKQEIGKERRIALKDAYKFFPADDEDLSELTDDDFEAIAQVCYAQLEQEQFQIEKERIQCEKKEQKLRDEAELRGRRSNELEPYIVFIRNYNELLNKSEEEYQNELKDIKRGAEEHWKFERSEKLRKQKEAEELRILKEAEQKEANRLKALEEERIAEEERIKNSSDKEKLSMFAKELQAVKFPDLESEKAVDLLTTIRHELVNIYQIIDGFEVA